MFITVQHVIICSTFTPVCVLMMSSRFGVLFLGGVELLRLTTPEPMSNKTDLHWSVEKDVTDYVTLFKKVRVWFHAPGQSVTNCLGSFRVWHGHGTTLNSSLFVVARCQAGQAAVFIPNVVDETYTGE